MQPLQQQQQQPTTSSKSLKVWFDEIKARVSKKAAANQAAESAVNTEEIVLKPLKTSPNASIKLPRASSLRARRTFNRISSTIDSPDYETASINTILTRRDSRYDSFGKKRTKPSFPSVFTLVKWVLYYLIPFNYSLPWKLLCLINSSFVIIVIGIVSGSSQTSTAFNFLNGFICGLVVALACAFVAALSFVVSVLPKSKDTEQASKSPKQDNGREFKFNERRSLIEANLGSITPNSNRIVLVSSSSNNSDEQKPDDFSSFEVLDETATREASDVSGNLCEDLDDDGYKGWMIEFIGDYEQRNTSEIKLKSVYVKLANKVLYLCKPKNNYDPDSISLPVFSGQRVYDIAAMRKFSANLLLPKSVHNKQKYVWSKKYPIRLEFQEENTNDSTKSSESNTKTVQLTLFAKSCREKEEWFRRFKRIYEDYRIAQGQTSKRLSLCSDKGSTTTDQTSDSFFGSLKRFRCRSPSSKADCVQTSRSSHILSERKQSTDDESSDNNKINAGEESSTPVLSRTKSCELLSTELDPLSEGSGSLDHELDYEDGEIRAGNDSTLTKETAEMFNQSIEYSNFMDAQPNLNYAEYIERLFRSSQGATSTCDWFNALTGRIFFDVFSHNFWSIWFKRKIQRKLHRIRLPYFMETLTLTKIDLGTNAPEFLNVVSHDFDSFGLSIDFDMAYSGGLTLTFETKLNLLKIKPDNTANTSSSTNTSAGAPTTPLGTTSSNNLSSSQQQVEIPTRESTSANDQLKQENIQLSRSLSGSARTSGESSDSDDSNSDSSSDSSFDEADANEISDWEDYGAEKTRQNIVKLVDKIASSRYFQHATENRYIKKKLQDISNCPLVLVVQIQSLNGVLTLNVPPPQTDRIWYGFKPMPELTLKAKPKMGDREVNLSHVTDWIERKLTEEFRKVFVIPNMEDIVLPVLKSDHLQYVTATR